MLESSATVAQQDSNSRTRHPINLNRFLEYMPVAVAMFDRQMRYLLASRRWQEDFGVVLAKGTCFYENCPGNPDLWREVQHNCQAGAVAVWEESVTDADGMLQWVKWEIQPWYDEMGKTYRIPKTMVSAFPKPFKSKFLTRFSPPKMSAKERV